MSTQVANVGKLGGWLKALVTTVCGLASGAFLMYVSPLLDKVIKPTKPVANFKYEHDGLKVFFQNRSVGGSEGWWDFGDGSALEPFRADNDSVAHSYAKPGVYTVKLSLRNSLGDENERAVSMALGGEATSTGPAIDAFEVVPIHSDNYAPATFRIVSKVKNAELAVWEMGGDRPLEFSAEAARTAERFVTFNEPGKHTIRLAVFNGKETIERSQTVQVMPPPASRVSAIVRVKHDVVNTKVGPPQSLVLQIPAEHKDSTCSVSHVLSAEPGYVITDAKFIDKPAKGAIVKLPTLQISPDKLKVTVSAELQNKGSRTGTPTKWTPQVVLTQEQRSAPSKWTTEPVAVSLKYPGTTVVPVPPVPAGKTSKQRQLELELRDGSNLVWKGSTLPTNAPIRLRNRDFHLTAVEADSQLRVDLLEKK